MKIDYTLKNLSTDNCVDTFEFDIFIYAIGYEKRSSFFRSKEPKASNFFAIDYECPERGDYNVNKKESEKFGDEQLIYSRNSGRQFLHILKERLSITKNTTEQTRCIGLDVSCLDRTLMSYVIISLLEVIEKNDRIIFFYTPSKFIEPRLYLSPLKKFGPAVPELSGFVGNPYKNRALIMGLGYEYGAALNVLNILEPEFSHLFYPIGDDERFLPHVKYANFDFEFGMNEYKVSSYNFSDPVALHGQMRDMIFSLSPMYTVMIVPFGPKLFSAIGILLCINNGSDCSFMRYSVEEVENIPKIEASGETHGFILTKGSNSILV